MSSKPVSWFERDDPIEFSGVYLSWVFNYIERHFWRLSSTYERDDLVQEAAVKFYYCKKKYGHVSEPRHFMSLFKTSVRNHFNDLALCSRIPNCSVPWVDQMGGIELHDGEGELLALDFLRRALVSDSKRKLVASIAGMSEQQLQSILDIAGGTMSEVSAIEVELCQSVGLEPSEDRSRASMQQYMKALVEAVDAKLSDDQFDQLSDAAQNWVNAAVHAVLNDQELPNFDDAPVGDGVEEEPGSATQGEEKEQESAGGEEEKTEEKTEEKAAAASKKKAGKKKAAAKKEPKPRKKPAGIRVKEIMLEYGIDLSKEQIHQILLDEGFKMAPSTVDVVRYEFRQAIKLLNDNGMIRADANIGGIG